MQWSKDRNPLNNSGRPDDSGRPNYCLPTIDWRVGLGQVGPVADDDVIRLRGDRDLAGVGAAIEEDDLAAVLNGAVDIGTLELVDVFALETVPTDAGAEGDLTVGVGGLGGTVTGRIEDG